MSTELCAVQLESERRATDRGFKSLRFRSTPLNRLAARDQVELTELAEERRLGVDVGFPVDDVLRSVAARTGVRPRIVQRINDFRIIEALGAAGHGTALWPRYTGDRRLSRRPLAGIRTARHVETVMRISSSDCPAIETVLEALKYEPNTLTKR